MFRWVSYRFHLVFSMLVISCLVACQPQAALTPLVPWTHLQSLPHLPLQNGAGMTIEGFNQPPLIVWPGDPTMPNLRLATIGGAPQLLALGHTPRQVNIYRTQDGVLDLLWLDQSNTGDTRLTGALLDVNHQIVRGPTTLSTGPTADYTALVLSSGDLLAAWSDDTAFYLQHIDLNGRPSQPFRIVGKYPALALDAAGNLQLAWVDALTPTLLVIQYVVLTPDKVSALDQAENITALQAPVTLGIITLQADQVLDRFVLGVDKANGYCLWALSTLTKGEIAGLVFPLESPDDTKSLKINLPDAESIRWPVLPNAPAADLVIGLVEHTTHDIPLIVTLSPAGISSILPVTVANTGQITRLSLANDVTGDIYMVWTALQNDQTSTLYYATTRP